MLPLLLLTACMPHYHSLGAIEPADLWAPLPVQHVTVDGVDIAYVDSGGPGDPVVLIHGLSSYLGFWEYQIGHLSKSHRVIALDLPGYGASARPDAPYTPPWYAGVVADWMQAIQLPSATVMGHSMGGQIALTLALDHPERVDALVLSAPAGFETFQSGHAAWMKEYWTEDRAMGTSEVHIRATMTNAVFNRTDEGVERLIEERVRLGQSEAFAGTSVAVSRSIAGMVDHPVLDRLGELDLPTLIVFGSDDRMIPNPIFTGGRTRTIAVSGKEAIAGSKAVMIAGGGHTVHHDAPAEFNGAVDTFLGALTPKKDTSGPWVATP